MSSLFTRQGFSITLITFLFIFGGTLTAQKSLRSVIYRDEPEMPTNLTKAIIKDNDGFIWIGTDAGLVRFDGKNFVNLRKGLSSRFVKNLYKSSDGTILVVTDLGIDRIVKTNGKHHLEVFIEGEKVRTDSTLFYPKTIYEDKQKTFWFSEPDAVVRFKNGKLERYTFSDENRTDSYFRSFLFVEDMYGTLFVSSQKGAIFVYDGYSNKFRFVGKHPSPTCRLDALKSDSDNILLAGTSAGVFKLQIALNYSSIRWGQINTIPDVSSLAGSLKNDLYFGSWTKGFFIYSQRHGSTSKLNDLSFDIITNIYLSDDNTVWVSSDEGFAFIQETYFAQVDIHSTSFYIQNVAKADDGSILTTDGNGVYDVVYANDFVTSSEIYSKNQSLILSLAGNKNDFWIGYRDGFVEHVKNGSVTRIFLPQTKSVNKLVRSITLDKKGVVWVTEEGLSGIITIGKDHALSYYNGAKGLTSYPQILRESGKGTLYCGAVGNNSYLFKFDRSMGTFINLSQKLPFDSLTTLEVYDISIDTNENVWLATNVGLIEYLSKENKFIPIKLLEEYKDSEIKAIATDSQNRVWLGYEFGVLLLADNQITRFSINDGLPNSTISYRGLLTTKNDRLWLGTAHGLAYLQKEIYKVQVTPAPIFTKITIDNKVVESTETFSDFNINSYFEASFISLTYPNNMIRYQYRVLGLNDNWSEASYDTKASIPSLPYGSYKFQVRANQTGLKWSEPLEYEFTVAVPWYLTKWAFAFYFVFGIGLIYAAILLIRILRDKRIAEERVKSFFALSSDLLFIIDRGGELKYFNSVWRKVTGYTEEELSGKNIYALIHPDDVEKTKEQFQALLNGKNTLFFENRMMKKDGSSSFFSWNITSAENEMLFFGVGRNISELMEIQNELRLSNINKDRFFSIIAHDLISPFSGLISLTQTIAESPEAFPEEELVVLHSELHLSAQKLYKLLQNLLEWSQMQKGTISFNPRDLNLAETVHQNIEILSSSIEQKGVIVKSAIDASTTIHADENMVNSVFRNLLTNAIKFSSRGGEILISAENVDDKFIQISVQDSGTGMADEYKVKLFKVEEKVGRTGTEGEKSTGLGLLLCKEFVEKHDGEIWVESSEGNGSTFHFTLPLAG